MPIVPPHRPGPKPRRSRLATLACATLAVAGLLAGCGDAGIGQPAALVIDTTTDPDATPADGVAVGLGDTTTFDDERPLDATTVYPSMAGDLDERFDRVDAFIAAGDYANANSVLGELGPMLPADDVERQARYNGTAARLAASRGQSAGEATMNATPASEDEPDTRPFAVRIEFPKGATVKLDKDAAPGRKIYVRSAPPFKPVVTTSDANYTYGSIEGSDEIVFIAGSANVVLSNSNPPAGTPDNTVLVSVPPGTTVETVEREIVGAK